MQQMSNAVALSSSGIADSALLKPKVVRTSGPGTPANGLRVNSGANHAMENSYQGFSLKCDAHKQGRTLFRPALEIRSEVGELVYERLFREEFDNASLATQEALRYGRAIVDGFCQSRLLNN